MLILAKKLPQNIIYQHDKLRQLVGGAEKTGFLELFCKFCALFLHFIHLVTQNLDIEKTSGPSFLFPQVVRGY